MQIEENVPVLVVMKKIFGRAIPSFLCLLMEILTVLINIAYIGHLNDEQKLAGAGLATVILNIIGIAVNLGFNGALETVVGQNVGAGTSISVGLLSTKLGQFYLSTSFFQCLERDSFGINFVFQLLIFTQCQEILVLLKVDSQVASYSQKYLLNLAPGMFCIGLFDANRRYLNCFGYATVATAIQVGGLLLHTALCYLLVFIWNFDMYGVTYSQSVTYALQVIVLTCHCHFNSSLKEAWSFPNRDIFKNFKEYFKLGLASAFTVIPEFASFDLLTFIASFLSVEAVGAQLILINFNASLVMVSIGLAIALAVLVGISVGGNNPKMAKKYAKYGILVCIVLQLIFTLLVNVFKRQIAYMFTQEENIVQLIVETIPSYSFILLFIGLLTTELGIFRGLGQQGYASLITMFSYFLICLPLAYVGAIVLDWGMKGMWIGQTLGIVVLVVVCSAYLLFLDWQYLIQRKFEKLTNQESSRLSTVDESPKKTGKEEEMIDLENSAREKK